MLVLRYEVETLVGDQEPERFAKEIEGLVLLLDSSDQEHNIGTFRVFIIDVVGAVNADVSPYAVFDSRLATLDFYSLYARSLEFKPAVLRSMGTDGLWEPSMLILDRLEIYPAYRGKTYGLHALLGLQHHFSMGCGIVAMKPFPLQFEERWMKNDDGIEPLDLHRFPQDMRRAMKSLRQYYARLGFSLVPRTAFMVRDAMQPLPSLEQCGLSNRVFVEEGE